jgi:PAS domain S-box-containing protein
MEAETEHAQDEIKRLQGCIEDLIGVLAFSAIWTVQDSSRTIRTLLDALLGMLRLDFAYARLSDSVGGLAVEDVRAAQRGNLAAEPQDVGRALDPWLTVVHATSPLLIPNPIGDGTVSIAVFRLGFQDEIGVLVAASQRADFPTKIEMLLLRVAANQAAIALQEARHVSEQTRVAAELERRVAERTRELTAANEESNTQMAERKRAEAYVAYQANLLANVHDAILATDEQFNLTAWNRAAEEMYGWKSEEVLGENVEDVIRTEISATQRSEALDLLAATGHYHADFVQYRRDGWPLRIQGDIMALRDEAGEITGYVCAFRDVTKRKEAEAEALELKDELTAELNAMTRLHELSTRLLASTDLQPLLEEVLDATMAMLRADFGNIQLYNPQTNALEIVAQRGFRQDFLDYFNSVHEGTCSCGTAVLRRERVVIEDVLTDPSFAPHLQVADSAGFRAVQSTPLFSRSGEPLAMISTHFRQTHRPSEHELRLTDLYARQAAELIELKRTDETLRASEERFRSYFELGLIGMVITSPDKICLEVNDELCRILGYERSELLQMTWAEISHPDDLAEDVSNFERVMAGEIDGYTMDKRWIRKDGRMIETIMAAKCLRRAGGTVDYFVGLVQDITERKLAEAQRREANERVEMVLDSITDKFFAVDNEWRYTSFNKHAEEQLHVLGRNPTSLIGKVLWEEFPHPASENELLRAMDERVVTTDEDFSPLLGEWYENRIYPNSDGGLAIFQRYITKRKRAEEELRRSEAYLAEAQRISHTGSWAWNVSTGELFWSLEHFRICGVDPEQFRLTMETAQQLIHPDDCSSAHQAFFEATSEKRIFERDLRFVCPDGTIRYVHSLAQPVFSESGELTEYVGTVMDVTERKRADEELQRSEAHLAEAQRIGHIGSWIWNVETGECFWSREHFRIFGLDPDSFKPTKENTQRLIHPEDLPFVEQTLEKAIRESSDFQIEYRIIRPDGSTRFHRGLGHPVDKEQRDREFIGMVVDVTERKLAEDALRDAQTELAHVTRVLALGELTASIAHEVNQPLAAIVTNGQASLRLLSRETPDLDGTREALEAMIKDGIRASEVIKRIRGLMKKSIPGKALLNINETIREVIALSVGELARNQVSLQTELEPDLPPVLADRVQVQQVVLNLVLNANEAMAGIDKRSRRLLISSEKGAADNVVVSVLDSGSGFSADDSERIFEAFFTTKSKTGGLGLGLSISRTIIEGHGGRLWASPNKVKGATFRFTLPIGGDRH